MKILAIRLAAIGDVVITLPWLAGLKRLRPEVDLTLLTGEEAAPIPQVLDLFEEVKVLRGGRSRARQLAHAAAMAPGLRARRFDMVLDLQNNPVSRLLRAALAPPRWSAFDTTSHTPHGIRALRVIEEAGLGSPPQLATRPLRPLTLDLPLLRDAGWHPDQPLVVLNPAGLWETRRWPLPHWLEFTHLWDEAAPDPPLYVCTGLPYMAPRAAWLKERLGGRLLDLTGRSSLLEAFSLVQRASLTVSEDGGLMHMSWASGVPTVALLGSTRGDQAGPLGPHTRLFDSGDLACGYCQQPACLHGDLRCLTRVSPARVVAAALEITHAG